MPRRDRSKHKRIDPKKDPKPRFRDEDDAKIPAGLRIDTTTSAYGDAGMGRPDPFYKKRPEPRKNKKRLPPKEDNYGQFSKGGEVCRGAGAAIKGTKFEGVF